MPASPRSSARIGRERGGAGRELAAPTRAGRSTFLGASPWPLGEDGAERTLRPAGDHPRLPAAPQLDTGRAHLMFHAAADERRRANSDGQTQHRADQAGQQRRHWDVLHDPENSRKTTEKMTLRKYDPRSASTSSSKKPRSKAGRRRPIEQRGRSDAAPFFSAALRDSTLTGYLNLCGKCGDWYRLKVGRQSVRKGPQGYECVSRQNNPQPIVACLG